VALRLTLNITGLRISEALTLKVGDVWTGSVIHSHITLRRQVTKGAKAGATFPLHPKARRVLEVYLKFHRTGAGASEPLFISERDGNTSLTRNGAWRFLHKASHPMIGFAVVWHIGFSSGIDFDTFCVLPRRGTPLHP